MLMRRISSLGEKISTMHLQSIPPCPSEEFLAYVEQYPQESIHILVQPFNQYEEQLRAMFAQDFLTPNLTRNLIDIFALGNPGRVRFRRSLGDPEKYLCHRLPNPEPDGAEAIVQSLTQFRTNFDAFTDSAFVSFSESDWSNIVVAGGSVTMCLQKKLAQVEEKEMGHGQKMHNNHYLKVAPDSDIDIFIYGIQDENLAVNRIMQLEKKLHRVGSTRVVRTRNAITFVSDHQQRQIQIILRLYGSVSELIMGFDVNCCCFAYNGYTVLGSPRG